MDYTMDTLSMENVCPNDAMYTAPDSAIAGSPPTHGQQFVHLNHLQEDQNFLDGMTLPRTSTPLSLVQTDPSPQVSSRAPRLLSEYGLESYKTEGQVGQRQQVAQSVPSLLRENGKNLGGSDGIEQQHQLSERQEFNYGDARSASENMEMVRGQPSLYGEAAVRQNEAIEVEEAAAKLEASAAGSYETAVSHFLLSATQTRDTRDHNIAAGRETPYTEKSLSHPVRPEHVADSQFNRQSLEGSRRRNLHYSQGFRETDEDDLNVSSEQSSGYSNTSVVYENNICERTAEHSLPLERSREQELAQSMKSALTSHSFETLPETKGIVDLQVPDTVANGKEYTDVGRELLERETDRLNYSQYNSRSDKTESVGDTEEQSESSDHIKGIPEVPARENKCTGKTQTLAKSSESQGEMEIESSCDSDQREDLEKECGRGKTAGEGRKNVERQDVDSGDKQSQAEREPVRSPASTMDERINGSLKKDEESLEFTPSPPIGTRRKFKCKKSWRLRKDLNKHKKTHSKAYKKFSCVLCGASFGSKALLIKHLKTHEAKPYICPTTCRGLADVKDHQRIHSEVRNFLCTVCSYSAKRRKDLRKHMLVHTAAKVHNCQFCKFSSKRKYSLQRHMKNAHSSAQIHECTVCNFKTTAVDSFKVHVAMHASTQTTSCVICGAVIKKKPNLIEHLLSHLNDQRTTCKVCDENCASSHEYMLHLLSHRDTSSIASDDANQGITFDIDSSSHLNGSTDSTPGTFGFLARKCKLVMDTPTMEAKISQMSSVASRLVDMTKVVSLLNAKSKVILQLGEISNLATELATIAGKVLQSYRNTYSVSNNKIRASSPSSDASEDSPFILEEHSLSCEINEDSTTAIKQELQDGMFGAFDAAGMQIQVDLNGDPISCIQKEDSCASGGSGKPKGDKQLKCIRCNLMFTDARSLKRHMMAHDDVRPYACEKCGQSFRRNEHLKKHMVTHSDERPYICKECPYAAKTEHRLKIHMLCHSQTKAFACQHCNYTARTNYELNHHMKKHEPRTCSQCQFVCYSRGEMKKHVFTHSSFDCNECDFSTNDRFEYNKHTKKHSLIQYLCCELCGYSCDTMKKFKYHKLRHENKTPFQCPDCDYKCSSRASFDCHRLKHAGLKPYLCSFCGASFRKTSHLNQHLLIHKDEKAFKCSECGYSCRTKHNLKEHEMTHSGEKPFACKYCSFSCRRNKALQQHVMKHESLGMMIPSMQMSSMQISQMQLPVQMSMMSTGL